MKCTRPAGTDVTPPVSNAKSEATIDSSDSRTGSSFEVPSSFGAPWSAAGAPRPHPAATSVTIVAIPNRLLHIMAHPSRTTATVPSSRRSAACPTPKRARRAAASGPTDTAALTDSRSTTIATVPPRPGTLPGSGAEPTEERLAGSSGSSLILERPLAGPAEQGRPLHAVAHAELGHEVRDVPLPGLAGQEQATGDVGVAGPGRDQPGDLLLSLGEGFQALPSGGRSPPPRSHAEGPEGPLGHRGLRAGPESLGSGPGGPQDVRRPPAVGLWQMGF